MYSRINVYQCISYSAWCSNEFVLEFECLVNRTGSPQDKSYIQNSVISVPNISQQITRKRLAYSSGHSQVNNKHNQVKTANNEHISISTSHMFTTERNLVKHVVQNAFNT